MKLTITNPFKKEKKEFGTYLIETKKEEEHRHLPSHRLPIERKIVWEEEDSFVFHLHKIDRDFTPYLIVKATCRRCDSDYTTKEEVPFELRPFITGKPEKNQESASDENKAK